MPTSITQFVTGMVVAAGIAAASIGVVGGAVAQSTDARAQVIAQEALTNRRESPTSETDFRLADRQQLRKILLGH